MLEMQENLDDHRRQSEFIRYLTDVILYHTPEIIGTPQSGTSNQRMAFFRRHWSNQIFGYKNWSDYAAFIAIILGLSFCKVPHSNHRTPIYEIAPHRESSVQYSVITLNYDLVLEKIARFISDCFDVRVVFARNDRERLDPLLDKAPYTDLIKLHGSIDSGAIIPPTWNKTLIQEEIRCAWKTASELLGQTNHIRILGYSLQPADSYVRYLFRSAFVKTSFLKKIDVLCLDPSGDIEKSYKEFITLPSYRFKSAKIEDYLSCCLHKDVNSPDTYTFEDLERGHEKFFSTA